MPRSLSSSSRPSVLIIGEDAGEYVRLIDAAEPSIPVTTCHNAAEALAAYTEQSILFGNPESIARVLPDMPTVEWVQSTWAGVTPLLEIDRRDYLLTGIKGIFGPQMSEFVIGYMLANELKVIERLAAQRTQQWFEKASGTLLGKKIGVMGTGSIGQAIARRAKDNGMTVTGLSRTGASNPDFANVFKVDDLHEFLHDLDYLVSVLPHTRKTDRLLDQSALAQLPTRAYFINVGRGNVIDDEALVSALARDELGGAVLDVFDVEPVPAESSLWDAPNLLITGHIAAISHPGLIAPIFLDNYKRFVSGQSLQNVISFDNGY
jgi:phosphoglycerate dehydrogenase-like enzyme